MRDLLSDDPEVSELLAEERLSDLHIRTEAESKEDIQALESLTLRLATALKDQVLKAANQDLEKGEVNRALKQERAVLYRIVKFCAEQISEIAHSPDAPYYNAVPYLKEFWGLYWGEMGVVENHAVRSAMIEFGKSLEAIDQRLFDRFVSNKASKEYVKDIGVLKGLTNRQAIQRYSEAIGEVANSALKSGDITKVRLDPNKDQQLLDSLKSSLENLKQALEQENNEPFA